MVDGQLVQVFVCVIEITVEEMRGHLVSWKVMEFCILCCVCDALWIE